jgi:hypothetical protein
MKKATKFVALSAALVLGLAGCAAGETVTEETTSAAAELPAGDGKVEIENSARNGIQPPGNPFAGIASYTVQKRHGFVWVNTPVM